VGGDVDGGYEDEVSDAVGETQGVYVGTFLEEGLDEGGVVANDRLHELFVEVGLFLFGE